LLGSWLLTKKLFLPSDVCADLVRHFMDSHPNTDVEGEEIVEVRVLVGAMFSIREFEMEHAFGTLLLSATCSCLRLVPLLSGKSLPVQF
jgi:hypothetical protein